MLQSAGLSDHGADERKQGRLRSASRCRQRTGAMHRWPKRCVRNYIARFAAQRNREAEPDQTQPRIDARDFD